MALSITVHGQGTFTASMEEGPVTFTAAIASVGPQGATGATGVVAATAPLAYDSGAQTVSISADPTFTSVRAGVFIYKAAGETPSYPADYQFVAFKPEDYTKTVDLGAAAFESLSYWVRSPEVAPDDGQILAWDAGLARPDWINNDARTLFLNGTNKTGTTIAKGKAVYISGATGNHPEITLAIATSELSSSRTIGITAEEIANNGTGKVIVAGALENVDTSAFTAGDVLYLSSSTAGGFQTTLPTQPNHGVLMGYVVRANANVGVIEVRVDNYQELGEQSDVLLTSKTNGDFLVYESATSLWKNKSAATLDLLTATTAASTYAPLASPALTGTPTAPTAAAATNTTQIATTAFVQQEVPAASTTVAGKVELATNAEAYTGSSTTLVPTVKGATLASSLATAKHKAYEFFTTPSTQSTGTGYGTSIVQTYENITSSALTAGFTRQFTVVTLSNPVNRGYTNFFNEKMGFSQTLVLANSTTGSYTGLTVISRIGVANSQTAGTALPTDDTSTKYFGWKYIYNQSIKLQVYDGTTYSETDSGYTPPTSGTNFNHNITCYSDGAGTATLEIIKPDGTLVTCTSSGCPTGSATSAVTQSWLLQLAGTGTQTGAANLNCGHVGFFFDW